VSITAGLQTLTLDQRVDRAWCDRVVLASLVDDFDSANGTETTAGEWIPEAVEALTPSRIGRTLILRSPNAVPYQFWA
jgi:hypothetical protein